MKQIPKKILTVAIAAALAINGALAGSMLTSYADSSTRYEFEDGTYTGTLKTDGNASNGSYIFFDTSGQTATVTVPIETAGMYDIYLGYNAQYGTKIESLIVNGVNQGDVSLMETGTDEFTELKAGTAKLPAGDNKIGIECSWTWANVDYIRVESAVLPDVTASDTSCCDPEASAETQKLMEFLSSVYGKYVISGQQEYYGASRETEFEYIENLTRELPVIRGFDFGDTCPLYAWDDGTAGRAISWVNDSGGIATASWHINVPVTMADYTVGSSMSFDKTTYSEKTDFVTANVMVEGTKEHDYFLLAVDNLAKELQKLQDANVPLLFRPFHEAEGGGGADGSGSWFWWSKEGAEVYVELYQYLYQLLTEEYGLHNLIWEFNSYTYSDESKEFYPGGDYVDIIGYDKYNSNGSQPNESAISSTFFSLISMYDNTKMIAMMENDTIPSVSNMTEEGAYWLYFMPWYDQHLMSSNYNNPDTLTEVYQSDLVMTLNEFKEMYELFQPSGTTVSRATTTSGTKKTTTSVTTVTAPEITNGIPAEIKKSGSDYIISFDQAIGEEVVLILNADSAVTYANGCVGISVNVDGTDYWVSYQWEASGSGEVSVDLNTPFNITYNSGTDEVTDEALSAKIVAASQEQTSATVQVWWANDASGDAVSTSKVTLLAAYIPADILITGEIQETTEATEEITTEATEETTTEAAKETTETEEATAASTETTTITTDVTEDLITTDDTVIANTETTTTPATTESTTEPDIIVLSSICGDIDLDGKVSMSDAILLSKAAVNIVDLTDAASANADCNVDGEVDGNDAYVLLKFIVQLVHNLPYADVDI